MPRPKAGTVVSTASSSPLGLPPADDQPALAREVVQACTQHLPKLPAAPDIGSEYRMLHPKAGAAASVASSSPLGLPAADDSGSGRLKKVPALQAPVRDSEHRMPRPKAGTVASIASSSQPGLPAADDTGVRQVKQVPALQAPVGNSEHRMPRPRAGTVVSIASSSQPGLPAADDTGTRRVKKRPAMQAPDGDSEHRMPRPKAGTVASIASSSQPGLPEASDQPPVAREAAQDRRRQCLPTGNQPPPAPAVDQRRVRRRLAQRLAAWRPNADSDLGDVATQYGRDVFLHVRHDCVNTIFA